MEGTFEVSWIPAGTADEANRLTEDFDVDKWPHALAWFCERLALAEGCAVSLTLRPPR